MPELLDAMGRCLRQHGGPVSARVLAERFLRLECDEETARRLLEPTLAALPGARYEEGQGWILEPRAPGSQGGWWEEFVAVAASPAPGGVVGRARLAWVHLRGGTRVASAGPDSVTAVEPPPSGVPVVAGGAAAELSAVRLWLLAHRGAGPLLPLRRIERALGRPGLRRRAVEEVEEADLPERATAAGRRVLGLVADMAAAGMSEARAALAARTRRPGLDFSKFGFERSFLGSLPSLPGVYRFADRAGEIYYVGKARNLKQRVRSYFGASAQRSARVRRLLDRLWRVEFEPVGTEADALLDEQLSIRRESPAGNRQVSVREESSRSLAEGRWAVVAPAVGGGSGCTVFFLAGGGLAARLRRASARQKKRLARALARSARRPAGLRGREGGAQVRRWIARRPEEFSLVDLDAGVDEAEALRRLVDLLRHYESGRERVDVR
jgi:hypothetical protein